MLEAALQKKIIQKVVILKLVTINGFSWDFYYIKYRQKPTPVHRGEKMEKLVKEHRGKFYITSKVLTVF